MSFATLVSRYALRVSPDRPPDGAPPAGEPERLEEARQVMLAVLLALADVLPQRLGHELLALIPGDAHVAEETRADDDVGHFAARVAERLDLSVPQALERAEIALAVLGADLDPELCARVERELPPALRAHLAGRAPA